MAVDKVTGLMWARALPANGVGEPCPAEDGNCMPSAANATNYCAALDLAGMSGWRVPSVIELLSIVDFQADSPTVDRVTFPGTPADYFWTSTGFFVPGPSTTPIAHWTVLFDDGSSTNGSPRTQAPVRCVKAPADAPCADAGQRFQKDASGAVATVTDRVTGLVWQAAASADAMASGQASAYCQSLGGGFRVPSANELVSLVDFSKSTNPAIDRDAFPDTPVDIFWTSTSASGTPAKTVVVGFASYGAVFRMASTATGHVRCVR